MLRCVDIPNDPRKSDGTHSTTYDRVDNDSDGYYGKSSDYDSPKSSVVCDSTPSVSGGGNTPKHHISASPEISKRPPMATPEISTSSSDDDGGDEFPSSGTELMKAIEYRMKSRDNRTLGTSVPLSDDFSRKNKPKPEAIVPKPPTKMKHKRRGVRSIEYSSDEDYDYTSINDLPRPLEKMPVPSKYRNSALSSECFLSLKVKIVDALNNPHEIGSQFEWKTYLSSKAFFNQFTERFTTGVKSWTVIYKMPVRTRRQYAAL